MIVMCVVVMFCAHDKFINLLHDNYCFGTLKHA